MFEHTIPFPGIIFKILGAISGRGGGGGFNEYIPSLSACYPVDYLMPNSQNPWLYEAEQQGTIR